MTTPQAFYQRSEAWLARLMEMNPTAATQLGDHRFDNTLGDHSLPALEEQNREIEAMEAELAAMSTDAWPNDARIDHTLITQIFKSFTREFHKQQGHRRNPGGYLNTTTGGVMLLIMKEFAPLADRLELALARTKEIPAVLEEAVKKLVPEEVPAVWAETAIEQAQMAPMLFTALLPSLAQGAAPHLVADLVAAGQRAADAIETYVAYLRDRVLPNARGSFAVGTALFDEMLREDHMVDYDAGQLLEIGWQQFEDTKEQMEAAAREIDPNRTVHDLLEDAKAEHPSAEGLLKAYEDAMQRAKQFVIDHGVASIPEGESLRIIETPVYLRPLIPYAAYMQPGILEEKQEGIFVVTPVDPSADAEAREQKLKGHYHSKLPVTALHEAYPGHHLQLVWANRAETIPRRLGSLLATLFIEGWAFYCEELMEELGFIDQPIQRLARLSDQLWRAARIILDVSLHTGTMTVDKAIAFLVERCQLEPGNATAEVRRYTMTPTQPQSYLMGKLQILDLVRDFKDANPGAGLREIHDAMLSAGSLPPRLMRQALLGG